MWKVFDKSIRDIISNCINDLWRNLPFNQEKQPGTLEGDNDVRKWKRGVIALVVFFSALALVTMGNLTVGVLSVFAMFFSFLYAVGLVVLFTFQQISRWSKERSKLGVEEKVVKTKTTTVYECGHCKKQYSDSQVCPQCGSPYRKTVEEKSEEKRVEKWKPRPRSKTVR